MFRWYILALLSHLLVASGSSQNTSPTDPNVVLHVSIASEQSQFHIGEKIPLELSYSAAVKDRYQINRELRWQRGSMEEFGVIDSPDRDVLAYHENHGVNEDASYSLGLIPPGHCVVRTYLQPELGDNGNLQPVPNWKMAKKEVDINGNAEEVLLVSPQK